MALSKKYKAAIENFIEAYLSKDVKIWYVKKVTKQKDIHRYRLIGFTKFPTIENIFKYFQYQFKFKKRRGVTVYGS